MNPHITRGLAVSATLIATFSLAACGGESSGAGSDVINQGVYTSRLPLDLPVIVAEDQGFFKDHGVTVENTDINTGTDMLTAIISGSIDVGNPAAPPAVKVLTEQQADLGALFGGALLDFRVLVPADASLPDKSADMAARLDTLKGKTVMVIGTGTLTDWWFRDTLTKAGVDDGDITIIAASNAAGQIAAFQAGKVDAIVGFGTVPGLLGDEGTDYEVLLGIPEGQTGDTYSSYLQVFGAASKKWQEDNADKLDNYCAAIADATEWIVDDANHDAAVDAMAKWTGLDEEKSEALLDATNYHMKLTSEAWDAQGAAIGHTEGLDFDANVNSSCNDQFKE